MSSVMARARELYDKDERLALLLDEYDALSIEPDCDDETTALESRIFLRLIDVEDALDV